MTRIWRSRLKYAIGGSVIGGFWYFNRQHPPWEEGLRTLIIFGALILLARARLRRRGIKVHFITLLATKAALVAIAVAAGTLLSPYMQGSALVVACGLGLAVAVLGAIFDGYFFTRTDRT